MGYELSGNPAQIPQHVAPLVRRSQREVQRTVTPEEAEVSSQHAQANPRATVLQAGATVKQVFTDSLPRIETSVIPSLDQAWQHNRKMASTLQSRAKMPGGRRQLDPSKWEEGIRRSQQSLIRYHAIGKAVRAEIHRFAFASHHRFAFSELVD